MKLRKDIRITQMKSTIIIKNPRLHNMRISD